MSNNSKILDESISEKESTIKEVTEVIHEKLDELEHKSADVEQVTAELEKKNAALTETSAALADNEAQLKESAEKVSQIQSIDGIETKKSLFGAKTELCAVCPKGGTDAANRGKQAARSLWRKRILIGCPTSLKSR